MCPQTSPLPPPALQPPGTRGLCLPQKTQLLPGVTVLVPGREGRSGRIRSHCFQTESDSAAPRYLGNHGDARGEALQTETPFFPKPTLQTLSSSGGSSATLRLPRTRRARKRVCPAAWMSPSPSGLTVTPQTASPYKRGFERLIGRPGCRRAGQRTGSASCESPTLRRWQPRASLVACASFLPAQAWSAQCSRASLQPPGPSADLALPPRSEPAAKVPPCCQAALEMRTFRGLHLRSDPGNCPRAPCPRSRAMR